MREQLVGCCGWREAKAKYFQHFAAVELQDTFYEPPSVALAAKWRALAPPAFHFCVKAWQVITHQPSSPTYRKLKQRLSAAEHPFIGSFRPTEQVGLAWERTALIARTLGARVVLFQCPKSFEPTAENLGNLRMFFANVDREAFRFAWEPRGEEWTDHLIRGLCEDLDLLHCVDPFEREAVYGDLLYWRLHGRGGYRYRYSEQELRELAAMRERLKEKDGYIFFNNVWMREDALRFQQLQFG